MSDVNKINNDLLGLTKKLAESSNEYQDLLLDAVMKRNDYDVAKAKAFLKAEGKNVEEKKAIALLACETEMREARIAEAMLEGMKARLRALADSLSATQTRASNMKQEMKLAGQFD
ncbi:MAG: hypothetical protein ACR2LC_09475 [Pyrinomonadaceae bacterium]